MQHPDPETKNSRLINPFLPRNSHRTIPPSTLASATSSEWQLYNERAAIVDHELMRDWSEGLNTMLIIVSASIWR
jgi:hypothetical protein